MRITEATAAYNSAVDRLAFLGSFFVTSDFDRESPFLQRPYNNASSAIPVGCFKSRSLIIEPFFTCFADIGSIDIVAMNG